MTLHYAFPKISNISDVMWAIEGDDEFIRVEKDNGTTVLNYVMMGKGTFPPIANDDARAALRRECRGLVFDTTTGKLLARRFQKFFNFGERDDLVPDLSKPHRIVEKLDGSMISPIRLADGSIRWGTKMGVTHVSMQAEVFVAQHTEYAEFAQLMIDGGYTPLFEWCSRQQRIVVDYPKDRLVLLAVRDNLTGDYQSSDDLWMHGIVHGIEVAREMPLTGSLEEIVAQIRKWEGAEGVVLVWDDGSMGKIKADAYVSLHRAKSLIENERDVCGLILDEKLDDLLPLLQVEDQTRVLAFRDAVLGDIRNFSTHVMNWHRDLREKGTTRKDFAINSAPILNDCLRAAIFALWDTHEDLPVAARSYTMGVVRRNLGSRASFARLQEGILRSAKYNNQGEA